MTIQAYTFTGPKDGKHVLILWAIHGNEPCWPLAIQKFIKELENNEKEIIAGKVTLIPICNPRAYEQSVRATEENLNRAFHPENTSTSYEAWLAREIQQYINQANIMLDIHSLSASDNCFLFKNKENNPILDELAKTTGIQECVKGRGDLYEDTGEYTTDDYGATVDTLGICIECGQHDHPQAPTRAYNAIINLLKKTQNIAWEAKEITGQYTLHMKQLIYKEKEGEFVQYRDHGTELKQWDIIAKYDDGTFLSMPYDGVLILPCNGEVAIWDEWIFIWDKEVN